MRRYTKALASGCRALTGVNLARNDALGEVGVAAVCNGAAAGGILTTLKLNEVALSDEGCRALGRHSWIVLTTSSNALRNLVS